MGTTERGREAFERRAWTEAYDALARAAAGNDPLDAEDLERLAVAACLVGADDHSGQAWERAHLAWARRGDNDRAARCAVWLAISLMLRGDMAQAGGWLARAQRMVEEPPTDCVARGLLLVPAFLQALGSGDTAAAQALAAEQREIAERFDDDDLRAFALLSAGQAAVAAGETTRGVSLLDEAMVAVTTGEVSPVPAGIVYCAVIETCMDAFDLRRAAEWTEALRRWCDAQPDMVPYRGQCLVHRSQVLTAHGDWPAAATEAERARERLSQPPHPALAAAWYQQAELHRLRGEFAGAETAYRAAAQLGREPAPGLALLRLADGRVDSATTAVRRMLDESGESPARPVILVAAVDILLAADDTGSARDAAEELAAVAAGRDAPLLHAMAAYARGSVLLAEGEASAALGPMRQACAGWRDLGMPYDAARARVGIGLACRALGDDDAAEVELDGARAVFEHLGAGPDLARLAALAGGSDSGAKAPSALTGRECEVLRLVAAAKTNREIAEALTISEHTVARHVQNIFTKLGLSSRAAATAYAYEHGLV